MKVNRTSFIQIFVFSTIFGQSLAINWENNNWAFACDFDGNDLSNVQSRGEDCGGKCANTQGCTHFTWTTYNGGTCWMKQNGASKENAKDTWDDSMVCGLIEQKGGKIEWRGNWAFACDFDGNDLSSQQSNREKCEEICANTGGCTHFTWTSFNSGTCWLKKNSVSKNDAKYTGDNGMICGIINEVQEGNNNNPTFRNVLATNHNANEIGACSLPEASYSTYFPVALGNIEPLQSLKFNPNLCGHVLTIDCGNGALDIIVTNSNLGGGLDLYGSTWKKATNNKPPGEDSCSVKLSSKNAFTSKEPICYFATDEVNNEYYRNVGLLNTGSRIVVRAVLNGEEGSHRGDNPYFAFGRQSKSTDRVNFFFNDGGSFPVRIMDCLSGKNKHYWS